MNVLTLHCYVTHAISVTMNGEHTGDMSVLYGYIMSFTENSSLADIMLYTVYP